MYQIKALCNEMLLFTQIFVMRDGVSKFVKHLAMNTLQSGGSLWDDTALQQEIVNLYMQW